MAKGRYARPSSSHVLASSTTTNDLPAQTAGPPRLSQVAQRPARSVLKAALCGLSPSAPMTLQTTTPSSSSTAPGAGTNAGSPAEHRARRNVVPSATNETKVWRRGKAHTAVVLRTWRAAGLMPQPALPRLQVVLANGVAHVGGPPRRQRVRVPVRPRPAQDTDTRASLRGADNTRQGARVDRRRLIAVRLQRWAVHT